MDNLEKNTNTGNCNSGSFNSGDFNSGDWNSGNRNSGSFNTSNLNSGEWNSGNCNSGFWNSGNCNSGKKNSGDFNSGNCNSGDGNIGNCNSGSFNSGDWNSGDFNFANGSTGCFNTEDDQKISMFNKPTGWTRTDWLSSEARCILLKKIIPPTKWINIDDMSEEEKKEHPEYAATKGYLKALSEGERFVKNIQNWKELSDDEKRIILELPNFDKEIFKQITGIDVVEPESETKEEDRTFIVTEWCDNCDSEIEMRWDTDVRGFQAICPVCGAKLMLCNECRHAPDGGKCDYSAEQGGCWRSKK